MLGSMFAILRALGMFVADLFKSRRRLEAENLFLRHQLSIALRHAPQGRAPGSGGAAVRYHCRHPDFVRTPPPLRPDMIFGRDNVELLAKD
jgi:hypothetical protein